MVRRSGATAGRCSIGPRSWDDLVAVLGKVEGARLGEGRGEEQSRRKLAPRDDTKAESEDNCVSNENCCALAYEAVARRVTHRQKS